MVLSIPGPCDGSGDWQPALKAVGHDLSAAFGDVRYEPGRTYRLAEERVEPLFSGIHLYEDIYQFTLFNYSLHVRHPRLLRAAYNEAKEVQRISSATVAEEIYIYGDTSCPTDEINTMPVFLLQACAVVSDLLNKELYKSAKQVSFDAAVTYDEAASKFWRGEKGYTESLALWVFYNGVSWASPLRLHPSFSSMPKRVLCDIEEELLETRHQRRIAPGQIGRLTRMIMRISRAHSRMERRER